MNKDLKNGLIFIGVIVVVIITLVASWFYYLSWLDRDKHHDYFYLVKILDKSNDSYEIGVPLPIDSNYQSWVLQTFACDSYGVKAHLNNSSYGKLLEIKSNHTTRCSASYHNPDGKMIDYSFSTKEDTKLWIYSKLGSNSSNISLVAESVLHDENPLNGGWFYYGIYSGDLPHSVRNNMQYCYYQDPFDFVSGVKLENTGWQKIDMRQGKYYLTNPS
jgi:hypothetical protein